MSHTSFRTLVGFVAAAFALPHTLAAPIALPFDAAYMVAGAGSTEPVASFPLDGPAPWLYVDLPDGALTSFLSTTNSGWFAEDSETVSFTAAAGQWGAQDKYWMSPTAEEWNANKAAGSWHIDASHSLVNIRFIYGGGGAPYVWAEGSATIPFTVVAAPPAMPGDFNHDLHVDSDDLQGPGGWRERFGVDLDGHDLLMWQQELETASSLAVATTSIPEPATALGLAVGILIVLTRRGARVGF